MAGGSDIPAYLTEFNDVPYYILVDGEHCPSVDSSSFVILKADRWDESSAVPPSFANSRTFFPTWQADKDRVDGKSD